MREKCILGIKKVEKDVNVTLRYKYIPSDKFSKALQYITQNIPNIIEYMSLNLEQ